MWPVAVRSPAIQPATCGSTPPATAVTLAATGVTDINSLLFNIDSIAQAVMVGSGNTLRFGASGGIFRTGTSNNLFSLGTVGDGAFLTAGGADNTAGDLLVNTGGSANTNQTVALNSVIADNGTGAVRLVKTGLAALAIGSANTFTGGLYVADGRVHLNNAAAAGTGPITIVGSGQVFLSQTATYANNFFIAGTGTTESNGNGAIRIDAGTITGTITLIGNARSRIVLEILTVSSPDKLPAISASISAVTTQAMLTMAKSTSAIVPTTGKVIPTSMKRAFCSWALPRSFRTALALATSR